MKRGVFATILILLFLLSFSYAPLPARAESANVSVTVLVTECSDSVDNDSDGEIDYPNDPGCDTYADDDETDPPPPAPPSSGGGGGGGGGYVPPAASVALAGRAYPGRTVTLLKDAEVVSSAAAGSDGTFGLSVAGLSSGNYIFSIYSEDKDGNRSSLHTFPVSITAGATTNVSGIFIAPTIAVDKEEVKQGDVITIFGQSAPAADIMITVGSEEELLVKTKADAGGAYLYYLDTGELSYGSHSAKSKATLLNQLLSSYSRAAGFTVGTKNVLARTEKAPEKGDTNADKRVNLVDFSVMAYWYRRAAPPVNIDLNADKKVDLVDFSIMAFYWTG